MKEQDNRRYPIGPFEYGQKYSFDDTRKHIRALDRFPKELKKAVKKLRGNDLDKPYRSGGWTIRQVIHHIADSHMNAYIRMKLAVTENTPIIKPYEEQLWAETEDGLHGPVKMSLKLLSALHVRWVEFLESLSEEDLERGYYHPSSKRTVQMQEAIALYIWHSQHHLHHIRLVSDGKNKLEATSAPAVEVLDTGGAQDMPKRRGPKPKQRLLSANDQADAKPKKRGMSDEHKDKIRAAHQARRAAKAGEAMPVPPSEGKRTRRTQAQMAADRAAAPPVTERRKPGPKPRAARMENMDSAPDGATGTRQPKRGLLHNIMDAILPGKRKRRTQSEMAADRAAMSPATERRKPGPKPKAAAPDSAASTPVTARRKRRTQSEMAADRSAAETTQASGERRKPGRPAQPKAEKSTIDAPKKRGMSAEHMAKIREARMSKRAESIASGAVTPKAKKEKAAEDGAPKKRGMSAEHMTKIREARMSKRAESIASGAVTPKAKKEKAADDGAPKKRGMSAEHMAKIREARMSKRAESIASGAVTPKAKKEKATSDDGAPKKRGMSAEHMAKIREARMSKRAESIASGAVTPKAKKAKAADDGTPKKRGMSAEHMAKIRALRTEKKS